MSGANFRNNVITNFTTKGARKVVKSLEEIANKQEKIQKKSAKELKVKKAMAITGKKERDLHDTAEDSQRKVADEEKAFSKLKETMTKLGYSQNEIARGTAKFKDLMEESNIEVGRGGTFIDKTSKKQLNWTRTSQQAARYGILPFNSGMLTMMFIGQNLTKVFGGMVSSVLQLTGIFDMFRGVLASILLPILMPLIAKWLPKLLEWLKDPGNRKLAGYLILTAAALGYVLYIGAMLTMWLFGFGMTWGSVFAKVGLGIKWVWKHMKSLWAGLKGIGTGIRLAFSGKGFAAFMGGLKATGLALGRLLAPIQIIYFAFTGLLDFLRGDFVSGFLKVIGIIAAVVAMVATGPVALIGAIVAGIIWLGEHIYWLGTITRGIAVFIARPFTMLFDSINAIVKLFKGDFAGAMDIFKGFFYMSDAGITGSWGRSVMDRGFKKPVPLADGGIVTKPTLALVGEAGPEAVVPLGEAGGMGTVINYNPTINISNPNNIRDIVDQVNRALHNDLRRIGVNR